MTPRASTDEGPTPGDRLGPQAGTVEPEVRAALRNASLLVAQRGIDVVRALAFAALVPRLLGPADFGRFALLTSIAQWFSALSGLGSAQLMGRFVPVMILRGERSTARRLLGNLLALCTLSGTASSALYLLLVLFWLRDLPFLLLAPMAAAVVLGSVARVPFAFFLGLNDAARWGAGEVARRWSSLGLVLVGTLVLGLRGACVGLAMAEVFVLALGLRWARPYLSRADVRLERDFIAPYLRYNLVFFAGNLLFALCQRGGEALVRVAKADYAEVGYFGVAAAVWALGAQGVWMLLMAFLPLFARLRAQDRLAAAQECAGRLLKVLVACGVVACFGSALVGQDLIPLLVGPAFRPAVRLLLPVSLALLANTVGGVGRLMALTLDRPRLALVAGLAQAFALVGLGLPLAARFGAVGVTLAMAAASVVQASVFFSVVQREAPLRLAPSLGVLAAGGLFLPLGLVPMDGPLPRAILFAAFLAGYPTLLRVARLVTAGELSDLKRLVKQELADGYLSRRSIFGGGG